VFVPETLTGMELLENFRASDTDLVFVVDEYGEVQGVITVRDVLEAITGEFSSPTADEDAWAVQREDGSWLLDGLIPCPS
jgi:putative hemolysin